MKAIDLFCGAGGLTRGLSDAGISVVLGIDKNDDCRRTYEENNREAEFCCEDLKLLSPRTIKKKLGKGNEPLLVAGCAPCQPFSTHSRTVGRGSSGRLLLEAERIIQSLKPEWVLIENVPGLAKVPGFSAYRRFLKSLRDLKYEVANGIIDAKSFGVPQTRRRLVLIASRCCKPTLPSPTHGSDQTDFATVRDAIARFPVIRAGTIHSTVPNHRAAEITEINLRRLRATPKNGGSRSDWPGKLRLECHKNSDGHEDVYGRMHWDHPAPTLTCRCFSISNGRYGHPSQNRAISLREAASLQTFPDNYVFFGATQRSLGEQIGNAVPVLLARAIGEHIVHLHSQH